MIIAIPLTENRGKDSPVSEHFGHTPYFAICNLENKGVKIIPMGGHGIGCTPVEKISEYKPDMVYTLDIGMRAMRLLRQMGIKIKTGSFRTVREVMENLDKLKDLEESCGH
jgi:predicted Fe-Mo cluster-binding NifX family protein